MRPRMVHPCRVPGNKYHIEGPGVFLIDFLRDACETYPPRAWRSAVYPLGFGETVAEVISLRVVVETRVCAFVSRQDSNLLLLSCNVTCIFVIGTGATSKEKLTPPGYLPSKV